MRKLLVYTRSLLVSALVIFALLPAVPVAAVDCDGGGSCNVLQDACQGNSNATLCRGAGSSENKIYGRNGIITKAINLLSIVIGVAAVIVIIIGGFKYILANGDSNSINSAKNTILYAIVGLIISILAQAIIAFVLNKIE